MTGDPIPPSELQLRVLDADSELGTDLDPSQRDAARERALAREITLQPGAWDPPPAPDDRRTNLGLLVVEGVLQRDVSLAGIGCTEVLGKGDVLHPWTYEEGDASVPFDVDWTVLEPTRLAVLDATFSCAVAEWPSITACLLYRVVQRTHSLAMHLAITCLVGLDQRLYVLFWHLADRFGRVEADGVVLPLRLTHETLAKLVAARRPSVTTALRELKERGLVVPRDDRGWTLHGEPPAEIEKMRLARRKHPDA